MIQAKDTPLVSVCCITYNHEKYIRDALEGFIMQETTFPFEVLIHDDASTDHTADIIREYEAKYPDIIKPIYQTENQYSKGIDISGTYNFPRAQGKYIALCEGDDFWIHPGKLQTQYEFMESHAACSMCFGEAELIEENHDEISRFGSIKAREYSAQDFFENWIIATCTTFLRKEVLVSNLYRRIKDDIRFVYGDLPLWLTASRFGKIYGCDITLGRYRRHAEGLTQRRQDYQWVKKLYFYALALHEYFPETDSWCDSFGAGNAYAYAKKSLFRGHLFEAVKAFFIAKKFDSAFVARWLKRDQGRFLKFRW